MSCVETSRAWRLLALNSALFTVMHRARSIMPWGGLPSCLLKKSFDCLRMKCLPRQSLSHALCLVSQPEWSGFEVSYRMPVAGVGVEGHRYAPRVLQRLSKKRCGEWLFLRSAKTR